MNSLLLAMLAHPSIASKEAIVRKYDHEVRGGTLVRPFTGPFMDGPSDAAVLKPLGTWSHDQAFALSVGINPSIGQVDPYAMAISVIDEAFRNAVAVGADPDRIAILDNFCWGNPTYPDRLGALVRCCQGCYAGALAYRAPFISGKDSLYNEFNGKPIPGTLLISAIGLVPQMERCVTSHLKEPGDLLYLLGESKDEFGGSLLHRLQALEGGVAPSMPENPLTRYRLLHCAIREGLVRACHDLSEGGLAVAVAEMALAGRLGAEIETDAVAADRVTALFGESNGRLLIEVSPENAKAFEGVMVGNTLVTIGRVAEHSRFTVRAGDETIIDLAVEQLVSVWTNTAKAVTTSNR